MPHRSLDHTMMLLAARAAWRGMGNVEPNPMVGCVIGTQDGRVLAIGHHQRFGGPHAEVEALRACARLGHDPRGATAWVTLEPCSHFGKTPPCADALIAAGIARVVYARADPNPVSTGGTAKLLAAGIETTDLTGPFAALRVADPFIKRTTLGLPWVIAKWAQTLDGNVAARTGDSKWISSPASRRAVHALRARVDAVLTGIGTVRADDPMLTARGVVRRRVARRVLVDPRLELRPDAAIVATISAAPLTVLTAYAIAASPAAESLRALGIEVVGIPEMPGGGTAAGGTGLDLTLGLRHLVTAHNASTVLVESGPNLVGRLFAAKLIDEALVFVSPRLLGDPLGLPPATVGPAATVAGGVGMRLRRLKRLGPDVLMVYSAHA